MGELALDAELKPTAFAQISYGMPAFGAKYQVRRRVSAAADSVCQGIE